MPCSLFLQGAEHTAPTSAAGQWELVGAGRGRPWPGLHAALAWEGGPAAGAHPGQQAAALARHTAAARGGALQAGGGGAEGPQLPESGSQSEVRIVMGCVVKFLIWTLAQCGLGWHLHLDYQVCTVYHYNACRFHILLLPYNISIVTN